MGSQYTRNIQANLNTDNIDGTQSGSSLLFTTDTGNGRFHPTQCVVETAELEGSTLVGSLSVGTNSPNYNNIASGIVFSSTLNAMKIFDVEAGSKSIAEGVEIHAKVGITSSANVHELQVAVLGYYAG